MNKQEYDYLFKILLFGETGVGKTSLLFRLVDNTFDPTQSTTDQTECKYKFLNIDNKKIKTQIWDYNFGEQFKIPSLTYYRGTKGYIIIYDISNKNSFERAKYWIEKIQINSQSYARKILIGNKCDLENREVSKEEGKILAEEFNMNFFETSAKICLNVNEAFECLIREIIKFERYIPKNSVRLIKKDTRERNKCNM